MGRRRGEHSGRSSGLAAEARSLFTYGGSLAIPLCSFVVASAWTALRILSSYFDPLWSPLISSFILVYGLGYAIPKSRGHPNPGRRALTRQDLLFGAIISATVFLVVAGSDCLLMEAIERSLR